MQQVSKIKVLLAEDDLSLGYVIKDNLVDAGYDVTLCPDGQSAIDKFDKNEFGICLLDVMMPNKDGFAVAKKIRQQSDMVPILFLTARSMEEDKIKGFQSGADDYITKPFSMQELLMRMEVFLRRTRKMHSEKSVTFTIGQLNFSYTDLKLTIGQEVFNLTQKEADLLKFLCEHSNRILKREEVLLNVWGKDDYFLGRSMDVF
ncbi:MAG TPA: response regulator transcription factor, partial [Puia sp.]|nr:response regulator transcription factor [Puia sp.]